MLMHDVDGNCVEQAIQTHRNIQPTIQGCLLVLLPKGINNTYINRLIYLHLPSWGKNGI